MLWPHHATAASAGRRRSPTVPQIIATAVTTLLLLLLSLSVLYSRLLLSQDSNPSSSSALYLQSTALDTDADNDAFDGPLDDDRIDVLDDLLDLPNKSPLDEEPDEPDDSEEDPQFFSRPESESDTSSLLFFDHALSAHRLSFAKPHQNPDFLLLPLDFDLTAKKKKISASFSSDDQPVDDGVKSKLYSIRTIEDALMVKSDGNSNHNSPMRDGWARWLEGKGDFLRRDKMLRSNLEMLNPKNHILIQDPDVSGSSGYTRGDRMVQRSILKEMEKVPFPARKGREVRVRVRRSLQLEERNRRRWGYFDGIDEGLSFTEFVESFFEMGRRCSIRVFMVWNSPSWMFGVRHRRGLESLLKVHGDACVMILSETMEMDFFDSFVKDGFKVAVAMPDLDELLKDTPTNEFSSLWYKWRQAKHYPIHYSELIRLVALYKFGGVYLDSDVIVLKPLYLLKNAVGVENQMGGNSIYNGAVMAFDKESPFLMECLREFYSTYDDARLRWNGADLLTRVINKLKEDKGDNSFGLVDIETRSPLTFFPISSTNITRYFAAAADEAERLHEETLFANILKESTTFHFWNSLTLALVPEPNSLVERLLNHNCLRCRDIL